MPRRHIFGSLLTFLGTWLVERWKNSQERNERTRNFILYIRQEFLVISKALEKLKTVQEYKRYYEYRTLDRLDRSITNMESSKKDAIYLNSLERQETFIDLISDISTYVSDVRGIQSLYDDQKKQIPQPQPVIKKTKSKKQATGLFASLPGLEKFYEERKTEKSIDLVDIKRRIDDFVKQLDVKR